MQPAPAGGLLAGVVGWIDLATPAVADAVAGLRALPGGEFLCGIRHPVLAEPDPGWLARPAVLRGLHALAAEGLGFDLVTLPHQLPAAVTAARSVPQLTFVLDHLGGPPAGSGRGAPRPVGFGDPPPATLPNVTCKLSGAHTSPARASGLRPYYETVLAAFGPGRLMFGSDWPVSTLAAASSRPSTKTGEPISRPCKTLPSCHWERFSSSRARTRPRDKQTFAQVRALGPVPHRHSKR